MDGDNVPFFENRTKIKVVSEIYKPLHKYISFVE